MPDHYLRKYGVATTVDFGLYKLDGTGLKVDAASATGDIKIMKDEGNEGNTTADAFVDEGQGYSLALTNTEMTAARVVIYIVDLSSPQVWLDKQLIIETYGNASAQHIFDLGTATQSVNLIADQSAATIGTVNTVTTKTGFSLAADQSAVTIGTTNTITTKTGFSLAADQSAVTVGTVNTALALTANNDKTGYRLSATGVDDIFDETLAGHSTADSSGLALKNALKVLKNKWAYVGTVLTIYDDNGTTPLYVLNLDSSTVPTSRTPA